LAALGRAAEGSLNPDVLSDAMAVRRRDALEAIADLRLAGLITDDGALVHEGLYTIARSLPRPEAASNAITAGDWSDEELNVLMTFFSGDRLIEIPTQRSKRRIVLERLAQDFEPGIRYDERAVSKQLRTYNDDYAALRRYLIDEGIMTRAEGVYWRSGGRFPSDLPLEPVAASDESDTPIGRGPILRTQHPDVTLTPFTVAHRVGLLEAADDERIAHHMTDQFPYPYTEGDADAWISLCMNEDPPINFVILVAGVVAGGVGCEPGGDIVRGSAGVGWWLAPRWWGRGIAPIAVGRLIEYCFRDLDLHRVEAGVFLNNTASARVAEKAGFVLEGIARDGYLKDGRLVDRLNYGLSRSSLEDAGSSA
jgi:ribosomal-protein-alanine N-acetyltransferase